MQTRLPLIILVILLSSAQFSFAVTDSLIIKGRVLNLNGRLYRQAPAITFSRNNILQPQSELSRQADLQADGSFRVAMPILYGTEEIYLDYSGKAYTTFLGSPGEIEISFNGDSIGKAKRLFYFAGVNATANNLFPQYQASLARALEANTVLGSKFYSNFWSKALPAAEEAASNRAQLKFSALQGINPPVQDRVLTQWVQSLAQDERAQNLYEYYLSNQLEGTLFTKWLKNMQRLSSEPLTSQRVSLGERFGNYADNTNRLNYAGGTPKSASLQVKVMATMIKNYTPGLTADDHEKLDMLIEKGKAEKIELEFLNNLYKKNSAVLDLLFGFESSSRVNYALFDSTGADFLNARYLPKNFYKFSYKQQLLLNNYIKGKVDAPRLRESLDELVSLEVRDTVNIKKMIGFDGLNAKPTEVLPEYWLAESRDKGNSWLNDIFEQYKDKTLYLLKWNIEDEKSRQDLDFAPALRARMPTNVEFIYLHIPNEEEPISNDLIKQYIVRHRLKGVHLFLNSNQIVDLLIKLNPLDSATYAIVKPNGKFATKKAPAPGNTQEITKALLEASN